MRRFASSLLGGATSLGETVQNRANSLVCASSSSFVSIRGFTDVPSTPSDSAAESPSTSSSPASTSSPDSVPRVFKHYLDKVNQPPPSLEFPVRHLKHYKPKPKSKYAYNPWPEGYEPTQAEQDIPEGVTVTIERAETQQGKVGWLNVAGPLGSCNFSLTGTAVKISDGKIELWGGEKGRVLPLINKLKSAFDGVRQGYVKGLQLVGIGYRVEQKSPETLEFRIGKSHPVTITLPSDVRPIVVGNDKVFIAGVNKDAVSQAVASIKRLHKVNVYTGKGIHDLGAEKDFKKKEFRHAGK